MPFRYVLKWDRGKVEKISVIAYPRYSQNKRGRPKKSFEIGSINGSRALILREAVGEAIQRYGSRKYNSIVHVRFPFDDTKAVALAYRIGLTAAVLKEVTSNDAVHKATSYILDSTNEEVWFWTSKLLDTRVGPERTITALCVISGAGNNNNAPIPL